MSENVQNDILGCQSRIVNNDVNKISYYLSWNLAVICHEISKSSISAWCMSYSQFNKWYMAVLQNHVMIQKMSHED